MVEVQPTIQSPQAIECGPVQASRAQPTDFDFDVSRTFTVLVATLVLPVYLGLSVVSFSLAALY